MGTVSAAVINQALLHAENPLGLFVMSSRKTTAREQWRQGKTRAIQLADQSLKHENRLRGIGPLEADNV